MSNTKRRDFVGTAKALAAKICEQHEGMAARRDRGYMVVVAEAPWIYVHHDNGSARMTLEAAQEALTAERVVLTVGDGIRPAA